LSEYSGSSVISFGKHIKARCHIDNLRLGHDRTNFELCLDGTHYPVCTNLIGEHNVSNITGAFAAAYAYGIRPGTILDALSQPLAVPGRLQQFIAPNGVIYFVDYAHTDDALVKVLTILKTIAAKRIITVFGCGGDRDRTKRPRMGAAAANFSDVVIVTSDNPRSEDPIKIIREVRAGIPTGTNLIEEPDRKKAILSAAATAQPGDIVLVAGKGHETYQEQNGQSIHFDDREIIAEICQP
jgi:UDP-N-acetylmuramyl-tripeptide synthetase